MYGSGFYDFEDEAYWELRSLKFLKDGVIVSAEDLPGSYRTFVLKSLKRSFNGVVKRYLPVLCTGFTDSSKLGCKLSVSVDLGRYFFDVFRSLVGVEVSKGVTFFDGVMVRVSSGSFTPNFNGDLSE